MPEFVRDAAQVRAETVLAMPAIGRAEEAAASIDEIIAVRIAAELDNDSFASAGAVSPLANVAYRLAKATHAPDMIIATMSCGHLDIAPSPMILSLIESLDCETAVAHAGGDDTYSTYYQAGAVTHEIVGAAQVDRRGRVNTIALRKRDGGIIRLPGQGGMADVANMHRDYLLYIPRHSVQSLVDEVEIASSARGLLTEAERAPHGVPDRRGAGVHRPLRLAARSIDPATGRHRNHARRHARADPRRHRLCGGFRRRTAARSPLPSKDTLGVLRSRIDPLGLRRLEFVSAKQRGALIAEILAADRALVERCIAAQRRSRRQRPKGSFMMKPLLDMSAARVFFDGIFTDPRVAHPEGVAVHRDGSIWCGTETGDLLRIAADGSVGRTHGRDRRLPARHRLRQRRQLLCLRPQA